ncbi:hypothetical protein [Terracidiphilus gabretensis]|jgi:hypothetical protein|uniref:hypothetical protein n=1 Tax=Terracidiphilus gabretensis TaxID=1577687 RepID=UPI00071B74ED|nr:hypothetical protein [Terracidiphilus gabretensis]
MTVTQPKPRRSISAAIGLFFLAPFIAEYLLGDLPITLLIALVLLAPMYGGGALLIREVVRRTGRGWPSIFLLGIAYGILEEAFTTQSLFNPNYLGKNFHLLDPAFIPALGIGVWWTIFVLTLHVAWSVCTSIAIAEALAPSRNTTPWLGPIGLSIVTVLFAIGAVAMTRLSYAKDHYLASHAQFITAAVLIVVFAVAAFLLPRSKPAIASMPVPNPWLTGFVTLLLGSGVMFVPNRWNWWAAAAVFALDAVALVLILFWSKSKAWTPLHKLALAAGAALAYGGHSFTQPPLIENVSLTVARAGNAIFTLFIIALIALAARRNTRIRTEAA